MTPLPDNPGAGPPGSPDRLAPAVNPPGWPPPPRPRPNRSALLIVWLVVFIDLLGFGIVLPVMPRQAEPYLGPTGLGLSAESKGAVIGLLFSIFSLMQFVFSPVWGRVSDRIGRRPVLLISLGGSVVFYALYGFAVTLPAESAGLAIGLMLASRVGAGIAGASVGTAAAVIADCTTRENRAKGMALIGIAFGAGFTFGPLIAWAGMRAFERQPWGVGAMASTLSGLALILAIMIFKETRNPNNKVRPELFSMARTAEVLRMPTVGALVLIYFLAIFAFANFEATLALLTQVAFDFGEEDNYLVFAYVGAVLTFAGGMYRPLVKKHPERRLMGIGVGLMVLGLAGLGAVAYRTSLSEDHAGLKQLFYAAVSVAVVGFAFVNPSVSALVSKRADPARQGEVIGVNQSFASLGRILGPFCGSVLFQSGSSHTLPYAAAVLVLVLVAALVARVGGAEATGRR